MAEPGLAPKKPNFSVCACNYNSVLSLKNTFKMILFKIPKKDNDHDDSGFQSQEPSFEEEQLFSP